MLASQAKKDSELRRAHVFVSPATQPPSHGGWRYRVCGASFSFSFYFISIGIFETTENKYLPEFLVHAAALWHVARSPYIWHELHAAGIKFSSSDCELCTVALCGMKRWIRISETRAELGHWDKYKIIQAQAMKHWIVSTSSLWRGECSRIDFPFFAFDGSFTSICQMESLIDSKL